MEPAGLIELELMSIANLDNVIDKFPIQPGKFPSSAQPSRKHFSLVPNQPDRKTLTIFNLGIR